MLRCPSLVGWLVISICAGGSWAEAQIVSDPASLTAPFSAKQASAAQEAWAKHLKTSVETASKTTAMKLRLIPPGEFLMGTSPKQAQAALAADSTLKAEYLEVEQPQHRVRLTKPFLLGTHEVTQAEYERVMGTNPSVFSRSGGFKDRVSGMDTTRFPVETVWWCNAVEFCNKLSSADGLTAYYRLSNLAREGGSLKSADVAIAGGNGFRLPTEAEWEYACRAGTTSAFHFGDINNGREANIDGNFPFGTTTKGPNKERTTSVGSTEYPGNNFGLRDMHGNIEEWCGDWYAAGFYSEFGGNTAIDPFNAKHASTSSAPIPLRVVRGGSWFTVNNVNSGGSRSADRFEGIPDMRFLWRGFRVARTP